MKIAFSTLGCPGWSWDDMLVTAADLGFKGIELRGIENEMYIPKAVQFTDTNLQLSKDRLNKLQLSIPALTSSCYLFDKEKSENYLAEGREYIDLAAKLGVPYVRVLGDGTIEPEKDIDLDFVALNLKKLSDYANGRNVMVLIETK